MNCFNIGKCLLLNWISWKKIWIQINGKWIRITIFMSQSQKEHPYGKLLKSYNESMTLAHSGETAIENLPAPCKQESADFRSAHIHTLFFSAFFEAPFYLFSLWTFVPSPSSFFDFSDMKAEFGPKTSTCDFEKKQSTRRPGNVSRCTPEKLKLITRSFP